MKFLALIATISAVRVTQQSSSKVEEGKSMSEGDFYRQWVKCNPNKTEELTISDVQNCGWGKAPLKCLAGDDGKFDKNEFAAVFDQYNKKPEDWNACYLEDKEGEKKHNEGDGQNHDEEKRDRVYFPKNAAEAGLFYDKCNTDQDESLTMNELEVCGAPVNGNRFSSIFKCLSGADGLLAKDEFIGAFTEGNKCVEAAKNGYKDDDSNSEEEEKHYEGDGHDEDNNDNGYENSDPKKVVEHIFQNFDKNQDGFLNREEVLAGIDQAFNEEMTEADQEINRKRQETKEKASRDFVRYSKMDRSDLVRFIRDEYVNEYVNGNSVV